MTDRCILCQVSPEIFIGRSDEIYRKTFRSLDDEDAERSPDASLSTELLNQSGEIRRQHQGFSTLRIRRQRLSSIRYLFAIDKIGTRSKIHGDPQPPPN
jgi:hypothetical protein